MKTFTINQSRRGHRVLARLLLSFMLLAAAAPMHAKGLAWRIARASGSSTYTLTFDARNDASDDEPTESNIIGKWFNFGKYTGTFKEKGAFTNVKSSITSVVFTSDFADLTSSSIQVDMSYMFYGMSKLASISGMENVALGIRNSAAYMFYGCEALKSVNFGKIDTSPCTDMSRMFWGCKALTSVTFGAGFDTSAVTDMSYMFRHCEALTSLDLSGFNNKNSKVHNMNGMFQGCEALASITFGTDFTGQTVLNMNSMFENCKALTSLDLSNFSTANVKQMLDMFSGCTALSSITFGTLFNTSNVLNMQGMFRECTKLGTLDLSGFSTRRVRTMRNMFYNCISLNKLTLGKSFRGDSVRTTKGMFYNCQNLYTLDLSNFITPRLASYSDIAAEGADMMNGSPIADGEGGTADQMFQLCSHLASLDISAMDFSHVKSAPYMLYNCPTLKSLSIGNNSCINDIIDVTQIFHGIGSASDPCELVTGTEFDISVLGDRLGTGTVGDRYRYRWLDGLFKLKEYPVAILSTASDGTRTLTFTMGPNSSAPEIAGADGTYSLNAGTLAKGKFLHSTDPQWICTSGIYDNGKITTVNIKSDFAQAAPTSTYRWFYNCTGLTQINGLKYLNTSEVIDMTEMFYNCRSLTSLDLSQFDTRNVISMEQMFANCLKLESLNEAGNANFTDNLNKSVVGMFSNCKALKSLDLSGFTTRKISGIVSGTGYAEMFSGCTALTSLNIENFNSGTVSYMNSMFDLCKSLESIHLGPAFTTQYVKDASRMFASCSALKEIVLDAPDNFTFPTATTLNSMFVACRNLTSEELQPIISRFNASNVTDIGVMFFGCRALTTLDLSTMGLDPEKVTQVGQLFNDTYGLTQLNMGDLDFKNLDVDGEQWGVFYTVGSAAKPCYLVVGDNFDKSVLGTFTAGNPGYYVWAEGYFTLDKTTGIDSLPADGGVADNAADDNAPRYNLSGQRVGKDYRGIVIRNGKKELVRN